jgi:hypothetical protein
LPEPLRELHPRLVPVVLELLVGEFPSHQRWLPVCPNYRAPVRLLAVLEPEPPEPPQVPTNCQNPSQLRPVAECSNHHRRERRERQQRERREAGQPVVYPNPRVVVVVD